MKIDTLDYIVYRKLGNSLYFTLCDRMHKYYRQQIVEVLDIDDLNEIYDAIYGETWQQIMKYEN